MQQFLAQQCKGRTSIGSTKEQSQGCVCTKEGVINSSVQVAMGIDLEG